MTTLEEYEDTSDPGHDSPVANDPIGHGTGVKTETTALGYRIFLGIVVIGVLYLLVTESKARTTLVLVVAAVGLTGGTWIGINLLFKQARKNWALFSGLLYALAALLVTIVLTGNRAIDGAGGGTGLVGRLVNMIWFPLIIAAIAGAVGVVLARVDAPATRLAVGAGGLGVAGAVVGAFLSDTARPELDIVALLAYTVAVAAIGGGISMLRRHSPVGGIVLGAAIGWVLGAFGAPALGTGNTGWAIIAATVPAALIGARAALTPNGGVRRAASTERNAQPFIFIGPAVLFLTITLVVPAIRTFIISLQDRKSDEFVGLDNYTDTFSDSASWDLSGWSNMFFSWPMRIGLVLMVAFVIIGIQMKRRTGRFLELGSPSMGPFIVGLLFVLFGVFAALRGTIINNLWWVSTVTFLSTALGLAVAVLADSVKFEKVAKSLIFMPMAISLVGASVIWRFMYVARDSSKEQTGVVNALWVGLGRLSTGQSVASTMIVAAVVLAGIALLLHAVTERKWILAVVTVIGVPVVLFALTAVWNALSGDLQKYVIGALLFALFAALLAVIFRTVSAGQPSGAVVPAIAALLVGVFLVRYFGIIGGGIGGQVTNGNGDKVGDAINPIQNSPYNNVFLMIVLIWIQTGFAMVILSAAIKAVPDEIIEAASVDGATPSQIFWRVTLPQIAPTIGVVVTTIIVLVMKVFDIVKVMTNGNFGTQVLANDMYFQAFTSSNFGRGAALAMLIFFSVMPIMVFNIRQMQKEN